MKQRIALFIATEKGFCCLQQAIDKGYGKNIEFVVSFKEVNVKKSWDEDIFNVCQNAGIDFYMWKDIKNNLAERYQYYGINLAFAIGWKYLIPIEVNKIFDYKLIIFHDSLLPRYRGFAPTPTAIMRGEKEIGVTALYASDVIDGGDIILQKTLYVGEEEYISEIIKKQSKIYAEMMLDIIDKAEIGKVVAQKQNEIDVTYSIWRDLADCKIDWSRSSQNIFNMIRAVSTPYPGAFSYYAGKKIVILRAEIIKDLKFEIRQYGKIWSIKNNMPEIICGKGMLRILDAYYEDETKVEFKLLRERL